MALEHLLASAALIGLMAQPVLVEQQFQPYAQR